MTTSSKDIQGAYTNALITFQNAKLSSADEKLYIILSKLHELFESEAYFHMPVEGEVAESKQLDVIFRALYNSLAQATNTLSSIDQKILKLEANLDPSELEETIAGIKAQMANRLLRTGGKGVHNTTRVFDIPVTLDQESEVDIPMELLKITNLDALKHPIIGTVQAHQAVPIQPMPNDSPSGVVPNSADSKVQLLSRTGELTLEGLNEYITSNNVTVNHLTLTPGVVDTNYANDSTQFVKFTAVLDQPSLLSLVSTPLPDVLFTSVELYSLDGDVFTYTDVPPLLFVDNPTDLITKIVWNVAISSIPEETLGGHYSGQLLTLGDSNNNITTYAQLKDDVAIALASAASSSSRSDKEEK
jgi:hypothetical protein